MTTQTISERVVIRPPATHGRYYRLFGWTVWIDGLPALSGGEAKAKSYARAMLKRVAEGSL